MEDREESTQIPVIRLDYQPRYEGNTLKIYEDKVPANGHEARQDSIHHDDVAAVLPAADDRRILMVHQYRNVLDCYILGVPAGKLDALGEPKVECAFRELEKGTGHKMESSESLEYLMNLTTIIAFCNEATDISAAHNLTSSHQDLDEGEVINVVPCSLGELEDMIYTGKITDGKTIAVITAYARKYYSEDRRDTMVKG